MVEFPPLMPSSGWFGTYFNELRKGKSPKEATLKANEKTSGRDFARFTIEAIKGEVMVLSAAVEGGARQLRSLDKLVDLKLSDHGEWRRVHLRTLDACLGRKPYFPYLFPQLEKVYSDRQILTLQEFNIAIFKILYSFININDKEILTYNNNLILRERGKEVSDRIKPFISAVEAISTFGKETLLGFLTLN